MAALSKENYTLHKLHSLTGIIPVGYYLVQHLTLNTFSLAGPTKFNAIIQFFEGMPTHFLYALKIVAIWIPLIFHAVYGLFIASRAKYNYAQEKYKYKENRYFTMQRISGILAFFFLCYHMTTTSVASSVSKYSGGAGAEGIIYYDQWASKLASGGTYIVLIVYMLGILVSATHFSYGIWSFCIRWGITISERAQQNVWKFAGVASVAITLMGWVALYGFFNPLLEGKAEGVTAKAPAPVSQPISQTR